ncbi:hypothetical protein Q0Z83_038870 [Actinoplanes sichuanensis]|nr:hypothetical protein Q0Z83_038870 [Actinoplanes sichuanensis]
MRPDRDCRVCGEPWPCATAKVELGEQYRRFPHGLALFLGSCLAEAIDDWAAGVGGTPPDLYERFLGWPVVPGDRGMTAAVGAVSTSSPTESTPGLGLGRRQQ